MMDRRLEELPPQGMLHIPHLSTQGEHRCKEFVSFSRYYSQDCGQKKKKILELKSTTSESKQFLYTNAKHSKHSVKVLDHTQ